MLRPRKGYTHMDGFCSMGWTIPGLGGFTVLSQLIGMMQNRFVQVARKSDQLSKSVPEQIKRSVQ
jgi:hypothetical protein